MNAPRLSVHQLREMRTLFESGRWREMTKREPSIRELALRLVDEAIECREEGGRTTEGPTEAGPLSG